jgi:RNA polymerase sigma-70 factor, ECF subfamily
VVPTVGRSGAFDDSKPLPPSQMCRRADTSDASGIETIHRASSRLNDVDDEAFLRETLGSMDLVYNIARRVVPRREDAEDLVQETYLAAYKAWQQERRPRKAAPWLATICLNLARSGYRHRARRPQEIPWEEMAPFEAGEDPAHEAIAELSRKALYRALWTLSDEQRLAIALVDLCGFSTVEAARVAGVPRGTILSRLHRGRKALAALLKGALDEAEEREP